MKLTDWLFLAPVLLSVVIGPCCTLRLGKPAQTLHLAPDFGAKSDGKHPQRNKNTVTITVDEKDEAASDVLRRVRRAADSSDTNSGADSGVTPNVTSKFLFNDNHHQMMVHWVGKGSPIILTLARDIRPMVGSSSQLYISYDYGKTFKPVNMLITCPGKNRTNKAGVVDKFYHSDDDLSVYIFPDTIHNVLFLTKDFGETMTPSCLSFKPSQVSIHPNNPDVILAMDEDDPQSRLFGTEDFGNSWFVVQENVKSFYWGVQPWDKKYDLYIERTDPMGNVVFKQNGIGLRQPKTTILDHVVDFEVRDEYMFATRRVRLYGSRSPNGTLQLWVSYQRGPFQNARLPPEVVPTDFYVADASEQQVFLCVNDNDTRTDLYISEVRGSVFVLSLRNIVYFNPKNNRRNTWLRWYAKESFADIHKVDGLRSVYIASKLLNASDMSVENQVTLITYDKGGLWEPVLPPTLDSDGKSFNCTQRVDPAYPYRTMPSNCSLHFSQLMSKWYPGIHASPILSHKSAPGIVMATGVVGQKLSKRNPEDVFVSSDGGFGWHAVLKGHYMYEFGDHGGLIVAVKQYHLTRRLEYSWNEGQTWETVYFSEEEMHVYGLLTEPGEMTTVFSVFGSLPGRHSWALIQVDLHKIFPYSCRPGDYKDWSPGEYKDFDGTSTNNCLLGSKRVYQRRIAHAKCYNGRKYERVISERNCTCTRQDFECDFGFQTANNRSLECVADPYSNIDPDKPPTPCIGLYDRTRGYRKISGDTCVGGEEHRYQPDKFVCPIGRVTEFLLYSTVGQVHRYLLGSNRSEVMSVPQTDQSRTRILTMDYDNKRDCMYFADSTAIKSVCYAQGHRVRTLCTAVSRVVALRYDWMGDNLFWIDVARNELAVSRADGRYKRILLTNTTGTEAARLSIPNSMALDPAHGYIYFTDIGNQTLVRVDMDGRNPRILLQTNRTSLPESVAYDRQTERVFVVGGSGYGYVASMRSDGSDFRVLLRPYRPHNVAVYKEYVIWTDFRSMRMASKYRGRGTSDVISSDRNIQDIVAVHQSAQQGSNACSNQNGGCSHLCLARPQNTGQHGANRTCLCPETFSRKSVSPDGNERCLCATGDVLHIPDGQCHAATNVSNCSASMYTCGSGRCIPRSWICDHDNDCGDMSDEFNCPYLRCPSEMFRCGNNRCIPQAWKCDHDNDCHDNSDELHCAYTACNSTQFTCDNSRCISERWRCDYDNDCHDNSDEANCTYGASTAVPATSLPCRSGSFQCDSGRCIRRSWVCDGADDCGDGSDERGCASNATVVPCSVWQFTCQTSGKCIQSSWVCDGANDCDDGSDERLCPATTVVPRTYTTQRPYNCHWWQFSCRNGNCIPMVSRCDNINDCGDMSDEDACHGSSPMPYVCPRGEFLCRDGTCIPGTSICDNYSDCPDSTDEMDCDHHVHNTSTCSSTQYTCDNGWCIHENWVCDGERDCNNGGDEKNCPGTVTCKRPERFSCLHGEGCIPSQWICDGDRDCDDGSDEYNCPNSTWNPEAPTTPFTPSCPNDGWMCNDWNMCIDSWQRCNGAIDCADRSDEYGCGGYRGLYVRELHSVEMTFNSIHVRWMPPNNASLKYIPTIWYDKRWHNHSEVAGNDYTFKKLIGDQQYRVAVYVVLVEKVGPGAATVKHTSSACSPIDLKTPEGPPGAPVLLPPRVLTDGTIHLEWTRPNITNGRIRNYVARFTDDKNHARDFHTMSYNRFINIQSGSLSPGTYNVVVVARTIADSPPSNARSFLYQLNDFEVTRPGATNKSTNGADLVWGPPNGTVDGFVAYGVEVFRGDQLVLNATTVETRYSVRNLTSGSWYQAIIIVKTKYGDGPSAKVYFNTKGDEPPALTGLTASLVNNNVLQVSWDGPKVKPKEGDWIYTVYYDYRGENMQDHTIRSSASHVDVTGATKVMISKLYGCEEYFIRVGVTGPNGPGPLSPETSVRTSYDPSHKPKHLGASFENGTLILQWTVDCDFLVEPLGYIVRISENDSFHDFKILKTTVSVVKHNFTSGLARGAVYGIAVRANVDHGKFSQPVNVKIPPYPAPSHLRIVTTDHDLALTWEYAEKLANNSHFEIYFAHSHGNSSSQFAYLGNATDAKFAISKDDLFDKTLSLLSDVKRSMSFAFKIRVSVEKGYPGLFSRSEKEDVDLNYHAMPSPVLSKANWMAVTIAGVVVVLALAVALVVYVVRHRRLQRSFMLFANSRYDTRSGTTTFSTGDDDLEDEDAPMITGFSDDEPLVIG